MHIGTHKNCHMKILHILDHSVPLQDGYALRTLAILKHQRQRGWETALITGSKQGVCAVELEEIGDFAFYRTSPGRILGKLPVLDNWDVITSLARRLDEVISIERPDVLHAHSPALTGVAAIKAGRKHGIKVVYECRAFWEDAAVSNGTTKEGGLRYRLTRALETWLFHRAHMVTCICAGLRNDIAARGIDSDKLVVIPNAVDCGSFPKLKGEDETVRNALGLGNTPILGYIGSFYAWEGLDIALRAMPEILAHLPDARFLLLGEGYEEENLKSLCRELGLQDRVLFLDRVPHDEVYQYYDAVDVLLYPRRSSRLTELVTPLKPLEANALGKLLIASDVGGHRELIRDKETGLLFKSGDIPALSTLVIDFFEHRERWPALIEAGREFVQMERTWDASVSRYQPIYEALCTR